MSNWQNILQQDDELSSDELMKYLQGTLNEDERHAIEAKLLDSSFADDALQGLQSFKDKKNIQQYVEELNKQLQLQTAAKKKRKAKRKLKGIDWLMITVITILLLCILGYSVIHLYYKNKKVNMEQKISH